MHTIDRHTAAPRTTTPSAGPAAAQASAGSALAVVEAELNRCCEPLVALSAGGRLPAAAWQAALQRLQVHLHLVASQLLPLWRDRCVDGGAVDRAEVRLAQLRRLVDETLAAGPDDPLAPARCAVLLEGLQQQRVRTVVLLRALDAVAPADMLAALADLWAGEGQRLRTLLDQGQSAGFENEDADPVGRPPR